MPDTKKEEGGQETSTTQSNVAAKKPNVLSGSQTSSEPEVSEAKTITLQEHLAQMENRSNNFPSINLASTTIAKVSDVTTAPPKTEQKPVEKVVESTKSEANPEPTVTIKPLSEPLVTRKTEPAQRVLDETEPAMKMNKTVLAFGMGLLMGVTIVSLLF